MSAATDFVEALGVKHAFVRASYSFETISPSDLKQIQKLAFELHLGDNINANCLASGVAVAAVCLTGYFLEKKYGLVSRIIGRGSVIYEVSYPTASSGAFDQLLNSGELEYGLKKMFENLEKSLQDLGCDDLLAELKDNDGLAELAEVRLISFQSMDVESVQKQLENLQDLATKAKLSAPPAPRGLRVDQNLQSPSTSILVYYQPPDEEVDDYVITIKNVMDEKDSTRLGTADEYAVVSGLQPRQSYFVWVQSQRSGVLSRKSMLEQPIETAQFDPRPWRAFDGAASESGYGTASVKTDEMYGAKESGFHDDEDASEATGLWETDLPKELRKIYPPSFTDLKLKRLLFKFDELGVAEAKDLKYFNSKEVAELLKEALKPIEILKLMDYASDSGSGTSNAERNPSSSGLSIGRFIGGTLFSDIILSGESAMNVRQSNNK